MAKPSSNNEVVDETIEEDVEISLHGEEDLLWLDNQIHKIASNITKAIREPFIQQSMPLLHSILN